MRETLPLDPGLVGALWKFDPSHRSPIHRHDELEFNLCLAGRADYLVRDQKVLLSRGTILWLFPEEDHVLVQASTDFSMWIGVYRRSLVEALASQELRQPLVDLKPERVRFAQLHGGTSSRLVALLDTVFESRSDPEAFNLGAPFALLVAWDAFLMSVGTDATVPVHPAVRKAAYLLSKAPTLKSIELAQAVGLTYAHLSRLFAKELNVTLVRYRQERLVERFLELASARPEDTALGIALEVGFGSYAQFYRVFVSVYGKTPAMFLADASLRGVMFESRK